MISTRDHVLRQLAARTSKLVSGLQVRVDSEHIVLTGRAPSYYVKQVATQAALAAAGARRVRNEITVESVPQIPRQPTTPPSGEEVRPLT